MNLIVRFYWQHDLDLIGLAACPDFSMGKWLKRAVISYARGEPLSIPIPEPPEKTVVLANTYAHFVLISGKDDDVIAVMKSIRYGQRNAAIKQIFRAYLSQPFFTPYLDTAMYQVETKNGHRHGDGGYVSRRPRGKVLPKPPERLLKTQEEVKEEIAAEDAVRKSAAAVSSAASPEPAGCPAFSGKGAVMEPKKRSRYADWDDDACEAKRDEMVSGGSFDLFSSLDNIIDD